LAEKVSRPARSLRLTLYFKVVATKMGVKCIAVFLALFSSVEVAISCDAAGLSKCNQDYLSGLSGVSGTNQTCSHISTMMECLKSKCSGCAGNVMAPFTTVKDNACGSGKTCEGTSLCDMSLECGSNGSSGAASVTLSRLAIIIACLVFFNSTVISMIDLLIRHLTKEMTVSETDEEHAQKEYEGFMSDSAGKRAKAVKAIGIKEAAKADSEAVKTAHEGDKKVTDDKLQATKVYEQQLHVECDWLLQNYDLRKTARADEADVLKQAKAVLKGADFSLAETASSDKAHR